MLSSWRLKVHVGEIVIVSKKIGSIVVEKVEVEFLGTQPKFTEAAIKAGIQHYLRVKPFFLGKSIEDGYSPLHYAVKHGNTAMVESVLQCGVSPLLKTKLGETATDIAVRNKNSDIVTLLDLYYPGLEQCIMNKDMSGAMNLLNRWVNLNNVARSVTNCALFNDNMNSMRLEYYIVQNNFIHLLAADDYDEFANLLSRQDPHRSVNVNCIHADNGSTPLSLAIQNLNAKMVRLLLDFGANPTTRLCDGTPLAHYSWSINAPFQIILCLLRDPQTWHMRSPLTGLTIFFSLVTDTDITTVHIYKLLELTECVVLIDRDWEGRDIQDFCLLYNRLDIIETIQKAIVELLSKRSGKLRLISLAVALLGRTVLDVPKETFKKVYDESVLESMIEVYDQFMSNVSLLEVESNELFDSVKKGDLAAVKRHNVADFINKNGRTALHEAILNDRYDVAVWLVAERPSLNTIGDLYNRYPLHYAYAVAHQYGKKYVHLLLDNGDNADLVKLTDVNNNIPSMLDCDMVQLFRTPDQLS